MAQVESTDLFIVDRKGLTYKTTFADIEESLNLEHDYTATVNETTGGTIESFTITDGGTGFIEGRTYIGEYAGLEITFEFSFFG